MRNRFLVILPLIIAYLLMLSHDVIPHHHHDNLLEAAHHHAIEHGDHHHHDGEKEGHEHTMHMVHSPEFGSYLPSKSSSVQNTSIDIEYFLSNEMKNLFSSIQSDGIPQLWYEDNPPPLLRLYYSSFPFRGPPVTFI